MKTWSIIIFSFLLFACNSTTEPANKDLRNDSIMNAATPPVKATKDPYYETDNSFPDNENGFKLMKTEMLGNLKLGIDSKKAIAELGDPEKKSAAQLWGADGLYHQDWTYDAAGIHLNMSGEDSLKMEIFYISFFAPCTLKTSRDIGIGSSFDEVKEAYKEELDKNAEGEQYLLAGSIYGGVIFNFENKKLSTVFIGAAAE